MMPRVKQAPQKGAQVRSIYKDIVEHSGKYTDLPVGLLNVDHEYYQRVDLRHPHLKKMALNWSWISCGTLTVSERPDHTYWILDGQRRTEAAKLRGDIKTMPCMVYKFDSVVSEAAKFREINAERKAVGLRDRHKSNLTLNDPIALKMEAFIRRSGRELAVFKGPNSITWPSRLQTLIRGDEATLSRVWDTLLELGKDRSLDEEVLLGLHYIESNADATNSLSDDRWAKKLRLLGYDAILESAIKYSTGREHNSFERYARGIIELLNGSARRYRFKLRPTALNDQGEAARVGARSDRYAEWYDSYFKTADKENKEHIANSYGFKKRSAS